MLEKYLQMFGNLRTDRERDLYPAITYHRAPHKPFLFLSVMDVIARGRITGNLIEPSYELVDIGLGSGHVSLPHALPCAWMQRIRSVFPTYGGGCRSPFE